jgi:hypothetical protein
MTKRVPTTGCGLFSPTPFIFKKESNKMEDFVEVKGQNIQCVTQSHFLTIPFMDGLQNVTLNRCVQFIQIDRFYGEFQLFDGQKRLITTSKGGRLSLLRKDIQTEVGQVWYDSVARNSAEYGVMTERFKVPDPGLYLGGLGECWIKFLQAPSEAPIFLHIPVYFRLNNVWHRGDSRFLLRELMGSSGTH